MARMDESELKAIVTAEVTSAIGADDTELSQDRIDGWDAYLREPYGNEIEGRSQVVSSDVQDTVEWIMPSLMRVFASGETAVEFVPTGPEDEDKAKQATDYCNYVFNSDNPGFLVLHTWFKEALIAKLGTVKVYWEVKDQWKRERYDGLDDDAYALVVGSPDVEIVEHTERQEPAPLDMMQTDMMPGMMPGMVTLHDVVVKMKSSAGKICVEPVPGDEVIFSRDAKDPQSCRFFAHKSRKTISDLIEQYPDKRQVIENLSSDGPSGSFRNESESRSTVNEDDMSPYTSAVNKAMREVWVTEAYIRVDYDGDGIAEMRKVTVAGNDSVLLDNEEWEGPRPFACISPILMPHRIVGISIADSIKDIQLIKTAILRSFLDSLYIGLNPRQEVVEDLIVDPAEVLTSKPGGIVRVRGNGSVPAIRPIQTTSVSAEALQGLQYVDQIRENRTGVSPRTQGLGADTLHDTKGGQELLFDAAKMRVELITRIFAETGVKDAFKLILWNANKYQDKARTVRLRNQWVPMDPREWSDSYDMTANVGLGHNDQTQKIAAMNLIIGAQTAAVQMQGGPTGPLVTIDNLHNSAIKLAEAAGFKAPELFFSDPAQQAPQPPKPDPEMMKLQAEMQMEQQKTQMDFAMRQREAELKAEIEKVQAQADIATQQQKTEMELQLAQQKFALERELKIIEAQIKAQQTREERAMRREQFKTDSVMKIMDARTKQAQMAQAAKHKAEGQSESESPEVEDDEEEMDLYPEVTAQHKALTKMGEDLKASLEMMSKALEAMNRPRQVVRGKDGKVVGLQ
jgi:hypothetical protein